MNILTELKSRFETVLSKLDTDPEQMHALLGMIRPAQNPDFGDYQANLAMPLGKRLGKPPRDVAGEIVASLDVADICEPPEIAGPGFINLRVKDQWLTQGLETARRDERLGVAKLDSPKQYIVDFSSPNVAKPLHVGHVRSTVIGDALCRILRFRGHNVVSDNHLGDWGTQFGMIIYGYKHFVDAAAYKQAPINELGRLYKLVRKMMDYHDGVKSLPERRLALAERKGELEKLAAAAPDPDAKAEKKRAKALRKAQASLTEEENEVGGLAKKLVDLEQDEVVGTLLQDHANISSQVLDETAKLHAGDKYNQSLWEEFMPKCKEAIQEIYSRLDVTFDEELGESFYHERLSGVVDALKAADIATESEGAMCVFLEGISSPFIVQKKDGAFLYSTSDLATIGYREERWNPDVVLYVVDFRQSDHFDKLFATTKRWQEASGSGGSPTDLHHIKFGTVLGEDKRPYKTRSGDTVGLAGLLDEAEARAYEVVAANDEAKPNGWELDEPKRRHIARVVGIAALKYADLSQNRESDYVFSYDKMLALTGNTATYMQYSYARVFGIFAKGEVDPATVRESSAKITVTHPAERALGLKLMQFGDAIDEVLVDYRPNQLTSYLFDLAKSFSTFFEQCPVLKADTEAERTNRMLLCDLTARTLKQGLALLGIGVVEKM